jgi:hypothetical protein
MPRRAKGLREIEWGHCAGEMMNSTCIYDNGVIPAEEFLRIVRESTVLDTPADVRQTLKPEDVQHIRFRPMPPSECRSWGCDYGVLAADGDRGYPVAAAFVG